MSTLSQSIPNLLSGISQQPDSKKRPGQLKDAVNAFPDFALGLLKRPGGKFVSKLEGAEPRNKWFSILRDAEEKYVGQYDTTDSIFRIWGLIDGNRRAVDMGSNTGQGGSCNISNLLTRANSLATAKTAFDTADTALRTAGVLLAQRTAGQVETIKKYFATDFRQLRNPRASDYADKIKEQLTSGVIEIEGTKRQATATVSVSNAITAAGVSDGGAGYETAPTVTISGSGINATATAVLGTSGDLKRIDITNAGADYIDVPTVSFGGGLSTYQGTAVVNWFTEQVTKVLVEDGDVIDLTDENERYELTSNVGKHESLYGGIDGDFESQDLVPSGKRGYNTGRPNMTFSDGSALASGSQGIYLNSRDLTGKNKIRIMAVTGNRDNISGVGNAPANRDSGANGLDTISGSNNGTYQMGTFNGGSYNDQTPLNSSEVPTLDVYIAREGITPVDNDGTTPAIWRNGGVSGDKPDSFFANSRPGESLLSDWRHIGQIFGASPATNTDVPYYLSEYEFDIPADLQTDKCFICVGASTSTPAILGADTSRRFAVTTITLLNATPTTTNIADSTVTFNVNSLSANAQSHFPEWNTRQSSGSLYINKLLLFRNGTVTPITPTTTATGDVVLGKAVSAINITNAGSGYNEGQATTIALSGGSFTQAATPTITVTPTFSSVITDAGRGYVSATGTLSGGGGGTGAAVEVTTKLGKVTNIAITGGDSGYTANPTITLSAPDLEGAQFAETIYKKNDVVQTGVVNHLRIANMGQGLTVASANDVATTTTGNGTGLTVDITVTGGQVTAATVNTNGTGYLHGDEITPTGYSGVKLTVRGIRKGTERTDEHPLLASNGYKIYELEESTAPANTQAELTAAETAYNTASTARTTAQTAYNGAQTDYNTEQDLCAVSSVPNDAYLKDATADDIEFLTLNDYTFVLNKKKTVQMTANTTHSGIPAHRAFVVIAVVANGHYDINLTGFSGTAATYNANSGDDGEHIAADLAGDINGNNGYTAEAIGPGIYITRTSAFTITTSGPASSDAIYAITDTVDNISRLPSQSKDGYIAKVINSTSIDIDDMYVKFVGSNGDGTGYWEETTEPGITYEFDPLTMPHQLVRNADGSFTYGTVNWNDRIVGDDLTNPKPSFVDNEISHIFFYRNRMGFLSGQNVILGKAGDLFNFWNTSAQAATDDDPIDISAAGKKPVFLNYVEPTSVGLVMYSTTEQFILTTDSDVLTPKSSKVNTMSSYECDAKVESVPLGTSQAFISKTPLYTRLFEIDEINTEQPPLMSDVTNLVPELIPRSIDSLVSSPALSIVSLGTVGSSDIFQYRFLTESRERRVVNSWYKWSLTGTLLNQFFDNSTWYAVVANGSDIYVQSFDMTQSNEQGFLTLPTGEKTDVCLDLFNINPHRTYDSVTDKTRVFLPYDSVSGKEINVVVLGGYIGSTVTSSESIGSVLKPTIAGDAGSQHVDIDGDFRGRNLIIGYNYIMTVSLPKLYRYSVSGNNVTNDDVSSLIIHRLKVKTGLSGPVDYKVSITGLNDWTNTISVTQPNQYQLNNVNMQASSTHVVPIFQRNENLAIDIIGNTPFPVSLLGLDWEGKLNQRFYRRG